MYGDTGTGQARTGMSTSCLPALPRSRTADSYHSLLNLVGDVGSRTYCDLKCKTSSAVPFNDLTPVSGVASTDVVSFPAASAVEKRADPGVDATGWSPRQAV